MSIFSFHCVSGFDPPSPDPFANYLVEEIQDLMPVYMNRFILDPAAFST